MNRYITDHALTSVVCVSTENCDKLAKALLGPGGEEGLVEKCMGPAEVCVFYSTSLFSKVLFFQLQASPSPHCEGLRPTVLSPSGSVVRCVVVLRTASESESTLNAAVEKMVNISGSCRYLGAIYGQYSRNFTFISRISFFWELCRKT